MRGGSTFARVMMISAILLGISLLSACSEKSTREGVRPVEPLLRERREKDLTFKSGSSSPLSDADKAKFQGLSYFDPNPKLRFRVKLNRHVSPRQLKLGTNTGELRRALRYGFFEFQVDGQVCQLQVYRTEDDQGGGAPHLFVPFRDATTGKTTYAAGRYLDYNENISGVYDLDFNKAYNPYCAYGKKYSCPLPPSENTLPIPILAGEMDYPLAKEH